MNKYSNVILTGMKIILENKVLENDYSIEIENGLIKNILSPNDEVPNDKERFFFSSDYYIAPGLIDTHIHGSKGFDVMDGSVDSLAEIAKSLYTQGVTSFLATTMTSSIFPGSSDPTTLSTPITLAGKAVAA